MKGHNNERESVNVWKKGTKVKYGWKLGRKKRGQKFNK